MQDSGSPGQSLSPSGEQRSHPEMAGKTADMQSDGGTQTEDVGRTEQDACMGYNHVYPAMNLAGRGTGGRSPVFQGAHLNPMFPDGLAHVPFFPSYPNYAEGRLWDGTWLLCQWREGASLPHGPIWSPLGLPWSFHGTPRLWVNVARLLQP